MGTYKGRTYCGSLTLEDIDKEVNLFGWADTKRDLGGIIFIEIRDVSGLVQTVIDSSDSPELAGKADSVKSEYCMNIRGKVRKRSEDTINPEIATGYVEVAIDTMDILNTSPVPPFPLDSRNSISEELRLTYRYLDIRRDDMKYAIIKRHEVMQATRMYLSENKFIEVETPMLNKSTPEGARDFLVPSRINKGMFYALPQSPQIFKQILMVSGIDRYFQVVKCFRDEDLRNDRQPEFTQIDMEMSFIDMNMIIDVIEGLLKYILSKVMEKEVAIPFPRLSFDDAVNRYGTDAPDTRFDLELTDCSDLFGNTAFNVFSNALNSGGIIKCLCVPDGERISRKMIDDYTVYVKIFKAQGLPWFRYKSGQFEGGIAKFLSDEERAGLNERLSLKGEELVIFSSDKPGVVNDSLANLRVKIGEDLDLIDHEKMNFLWVLDFPLLEYHEEDGRFYSKHHPFTAPMPDHIDMLEKVTLENVDSVKAQAYDIVLNGVEIGGGSIRIHSTEIQKKIFAVLGISEDEANAKFSFLLEALKYGAPPHGGIALGLDRLLMLFLNKNSIRDVIPFPKTQKGMCMMSSSPSPVVPDQLKELSIKVVD